VKIIAFTDSAARKSYTLPWFNAWGKNPRGPIFFGCLG